MADNDIKQKIVLTGEKEYNRALSDAKRNLKTLRSELKAETAELGANATAQQKNETKIKSLQKQIKEQEKVVKTYKDALDEVKEKYSNNEDAIAKWEQKLNDARASLGNMKNELANVGKGFKDVEGSADMATVATKSVADAFGQIGDVGNIVSDGIAAAFTGLIETAKQAISMIWEDIVDLAARSNNLVDLAGFWNTDVTTIQKYAGAVQEVSGTLEDLTSLVTKINSGDAKKIAELTDISAANYTDQWEYAMLVMKALSEMSTEKRNNAAFEIFGGKQATKAFDLLNDWEKLLDNLDTYDAEKGGYGLSKEELKSMSDLYDLVNGLHQRWQSLKDMAEVKLFGDLAINITGNARAIMDALLEYMNAGSDAERDDALEKIETNITAMFDTAKAAIEAGVKALGELADKLKESDNPTVQALGNVMSGLVTALQWITEDNMKNVVSAFEILAGFWLAGKGLALAATIAKLAANLASIQTFRLLSGGADIANAAAGAGNASGAGWGAAFAASAKAAIAETAPFLLTIFGVGAAATLPAFFAQADAERKVEERRTERLEAASKMTGEAAMWLEKAANALGANRDENGNLVKNWLGQLELQGHEQDITDLLMGLGDRSDLQKAQLYNMLSGSYTDQGNGTWNELQRLWGGEEMDMARLTAILNAVADAYTLRGAEEEWWQRNGGNSGETDGLTSADAKNMTDAVNKMPSAVAKGMSNIRVTMDGRTVGQLVAPYVSQYIGMNIG